MKYIHNTWFELKAAIGFLTVIPVRIECKVDERYRPGAVFFPLVGLLIAALIISGSLLFARIFPHEMSALLTIILWTGLTGALHVDGLADCFDGLLVSAAPERRREIMHDSRIGTFGATGILFYFLIKINIMKLMPPDRWVMAILLAVVGARFILLLVKIYPLQWGSQGMGRAFVDAIKPSHLILATLIPALLLISGGLRALLALAVAIIVHRIFLSFAQRRLGQINGDVLGMGIEISELVILLGYLVEVPV